MFSGGLFATEPVSTAFGIVEEMATMMAQMSETGPRALNLLEGEQVEPPPERAEPRLRIVFLPPARAEDAQTEGCNV